MEVKTKRILIFSTAYLPLIGGAEIAVKEITNRLGGQYEFVLFTARLKKELPPIEKIGAVTVHRIGKGDAWDKFRLVKNGHKEAKALGPFNAVWSIMASYGGLAALRFKKKNKDVPFLLTLQEGDSRARIYSRVWWCWPYFTQIFKKANRIQAISNYLAAWAKDLGAICPVEVVPNGVDLGQFKMFTADSREKCQMNLRTKLGLSGASKIIISVSRLAAKNGLVSLIEALVFLPNSHLVLAGDGALKERLIGLVKKLKVDGRVHFLGDVSHTELPRYLWGSSVFCRPSVSEGLGTAFLEAMAARVPVVATSVGGIPDFLIDGQTGWFCKINNSRSIAEKISYVLDEQRAESVKKVVERAGQMVDERYSWNTVAGSMRKVFNTLCAS